MLTITPSLLWRAGASLAFLGAGSGAFGAHGLRNRSGITADNIHAWETASQYAMFNGIALLILSMHPRFGVHKFAGPAIAVGAAVFSGSVYALVLDKPRFKLLGPATPLGGTLMLAGYAALLF